MDIIDILQELCCYEPTALRCYGCYGHAKGLQQKCHFPDKVTSNHDGQPPPTTTYPQLQPSNELLSMVHNSQFCFTAFATLNPLSVASAISPSRAFLFWPLSLRSRCFWCFHYVLDAFICFHMLSFYFRYSHCFRKLRVLLMCVTGRSEYIYISDSRGTS
jgi:hypothetical protein